MLKIITVSLFILGLFENINAQCTTNFCGTNGRCLVVNGSPYCECRTGFVGSRCQLTDPCTSRPCNGNGACYPVVAAISGAEQVSVHCQCYTGYSGPRCASVTATPCNPNPCLNRANCVITPNRWDYTCECVGPYTGKTCGEYVDYCSNHRCRNEARCIPNTQTRNYTCDCRNGFYGDFCEIEINECQITDRTTGAITSPCRNNATCLDLVDAYLCTCVGPYTGTTCETYVNPCNSNPCSGTGAICTPVGNSFTCTCATGFFGTRCQPDPCVANPCRQAGSRCVPVEAESITNNVPGCNCGASSSYVCVCPGVSPSYASFIC